MGSAAAYHLASRGKRVLGLEQFSPAHDKGSSHGESRIIRQAYYEDPAYVPLVLRAYELWEKLEHDSKNDLLRITGGLMIGPPDSAIVQGTIASARAHNLAYEVLDSCELRRRYPVFHPRRDDAAVYELRAGFLRPEACVSAHLAQAACHGADLRFEECVQEWSAISSHDGVRVITTSGTYEADRLVVGAGAWAPSLLAELNIPFDVRRHVMCWFHPVGNTESFLPERFPVYLWEVDSHDVFYGFPITGKITEGVKAAVHTGGDRCTPVTVERQVSNSDVEELRSLFRRFIPSLDGPVSAAATCMYTLTPDEHFVVSLHPKHPQVAIAAGFSGHGFKFTSVMGEILADLATTGSTRYPIALFSPGRFSTNH